MSNNTGTAQAPVTPAKGGTRIEHFLNRQRRELRQGGALVVFRKLRTFLLRICEMPLIALAVPVVFLVRALSPVVLIRFGGMTSSRIGHFAANVEVYLCERDAGMHGGKNIIDVFYCDREISNYQLKKMWQRTLHVVPFARFLDKVNRMIPRGKKHIVPWRFNACRDIHGLLSTTPPHLSFTAKEETAGKEGLEKLGVAPGSPFVCFHARNVDYLDAALPGGDWSYHNYRDVDIRNYMPALEELVRREYFGIRMGAFVKEKLQNAGRAIIDYAATSRTDFLDVYLSAKCSFFICDTAGIYAVAELFRRPVAWVNYTMLEYAPTWGKDDIFIPKKLYLKEEKRFLTFREILDSGMGGFQRTQEYEQAGVEHVENTPEEICDLVIEMDERLKGTWQGHPEDEELQKRFWSLFKTSEINKNVFLSRVGAKFLRQNRELLK